DSSTCSATPMSLQLQRRKARKSRQGIDLHEVANTVQKWFAVCKPSVIVDVFQASLATELDPQEYNSVQGLPATEHELEHGCVVSLQISIRESGDVTILDLRGRSIEPRACELLRSNLQKLVASGVRKVLLDITDLTQVDSYCVTLIVRAQASLRGQ